jgi:hypothetical protein
VVTSNSLQIALELLGAGVQLPLQADVLRDKPPSTLDVHGMRDQRPKTPTHRQEASTRQLVVRATMTNQTRVRDRNSARHLSQLRSVGLLFRVEIRDMSVERR